VLWSIEEVYFFETPRLSKEIWVRAVFQMYVCEPMGCGSVGSGERIEIIRGNNLQTWSRYQRLINEDDGAGGAD
jgi:hypothetical protein